MRIIALVRIFVVFGLTGAYRCVFFGMRTKGGLHAAIPRMNASALSHLPVDRVSAVLYVLLSTPGLVGYVLFLRIQQVLGTPLSDVTQ